MDAGVQEGSRPDAGTIPAGPAALFVGHPAHELCLYGWLEQARPFVFVLTDGSGRACRPRLGTTTRLLTTAGARPVQPYGRFTDRDVYEALLSGQYAPLLAVAEDLAEALRRREVATLVCDPLDGYNPSHDLCRMLAAAAVQRNRQWGRPIRCFESLLTTRPELRPDSSWVRVDLDKAALTRKVECARAYARAHPELHGEVETPLARSGPEAFRQEWLRPVADLLALHHPPATVPFYERYAARKVAEGHYPEALSYSRHVLPFLDRLLGDLEASERCVA